MKYWKYLIIILNKVNLAVMVIPFRVEYGEIKVFYHNENIDMGARIEFKGGACRLFETFLDEQNRTGKTF